MADISKITTLDGTTYNIKDATARANSGVTGVKGNSESSYRTGNVNLTAANIGAAASSHTHLVTDISQGQAAVVEGLDPLTQALVGSAASNKSFGLPANAITIEYSTNGGSSWSSYGATDDQKKALFAETRTFTPILGKSASKDTNTVNNQLRVTIEPTDRYVYFNGLYIWMSTQGNTVTVDLERSTIGAKDTFTTVFTAQAINGWSGNNIRYFSGGTFGGGSTQTSNNYKYRLTFKQTAINANYNSAQIIDIRFFGVNVWTSPNNMVSKNHLYSWDTDLNATFPANVSATKFVGALQGNADTATNATTVNNHTVNTDVPSNAVFTDTKNTAGSTDSSSKLFLIGATSQAANPQTYSHDTAYVGTDGCLYSGGTKVLTSHQSLANYAPLASPALTGTPTAPTAANGTNTTQIATTAFVMNAFTANDAMVFKGTIGTGGTVTSLPTTHSQGWTYKVITAATYAGKVCEVGDMIICVADGTVAADADWTVVQTNIDGAVTGPASSTGDHIAAFNGTSGKVIKDSGYTIATSVPSGAVFTDTKNTAGSTDSSSKLFLIGATSQADNPQTYSQDTAYVGTDGCLYSNSTKVLTAHQTIKQDGVTGATVNRYGECTTGSNTAAKTVSVTSGTFALEAGARVTVKFKYTNGANNPTLNVNATGGKNIFHAGSQIKTGNATSMLTGIVEFIYDGTQWHLIGNHDTTIASQLSRLVTTTVPNVTSAGSAPTLGTAIPADDITSWSPGTVPTLGTAIPADDITSWSAGTLPTLGTAISADDITAWSAGTLPTLGTAISADDITSWSAGTVPTLGTAIPADDITSWTTNIPTTFSVSGEKLSITSGTAASLSYTAKSIPNVTSVGTVPTLEYTAKSIPNVTGVGTLPSLSYTSRSIPNVTGVGTLPALEYTAKSIPNVTSVGTAPSLEYTAKSIPNVTSVGSAPTLGTAITVATGSLSESGTGGYVAIGTTRV